MWRDETEKRIIFRTEKALLNKRIADVIKKRKQLKSKHSQLKEEIRELLPPELLEEIIKVNLERQKKEEEKSRKKQRDEYHRLKYGVRYVDYVNSENNANQLEVEQQNLQKTKWVA